MGQQDRARTGKDTMVASKRIKLRQLTNVSTLGETSMWVHEVDEADDKVAPKKYDQATCCEQLGDSMLLARGSSTLRRQTDQVEIHNKIKRD